MLKSLVFPNRSRKYEGEMIKILFFPFLFLFGKLHHSTESPIVDFVTVHIKQFCLSLTLKCNALLNLQSGITYVLFLLCSVPSSCMIFCEPNKFSFGKSHLYESPALTRMRSFWVSFGFSFLHIVWLLVAVTKLTGRSFSFSATDFW